MSLAKAGRATYGTRLGRRNRLTDHPIVKNGEMIYWSRRAGQHVVHVDDFRNGVAYTNIFLPDGTASRRKGTLVEIKKRRLPSVVASPIQWACQRMPSL